MFLPSQGMDFREVSYQCSRVSPRCGKYSCGWNRLGWAISDVFVAGTAISTCQALPRLKEVHKENENTFSISFFLPFFYYAASMPVKVDFAYYNWQIAKRIITHFLPFFLLLLTLSQAIATFSLTVSRQQIRSLRKAPFMIESLTFKICERCSYLVVDPVTYYSTPCFYKKWLNKFPNFFQERIRYRCCIFKRSFNPWRKRNVTIYICMVIGFI